MRVQAIAALGSVLGSFRDISPCERRECMSCLIFEPFFVKEESTAEEEKRIENPVRSGGTSSVAPFLLLLLRSILAFETELLRLLEETKEDEEVPLLAITNNDITEILVANSGPLTTMESSKVAAAPDTKKKHQ